MTNYHIRPHRPKTAIHRTMADNNMPPNCPSAGNWA